MSRKTYNLVAVHRIRGIKPNRQFIEPGEKFQATPENGDQEQMVQQLLASGAAVEEVEEDLAEPDTDEGAGPETQDPEPEADTDEGTGPETQDPEPEAAPAKEKPVAKEKKSTTASKARAAAQ